MLIKVEDSLLDLCNVLSGVPQGSVFGHLLFVIFINNIPEHICIQFAILFIFANDNILPIVLEALIRILSLLLHMIQPLGTIWLQIFARCKCYTTSKALFQPSTHYIYRQLVYISIQKSIDASLMHYAFLSILLGKHMASHLHCSCLPS